MSPVCLDLTVLETGRHNGQTQSDGFCPDATTTRLFHSLPHIRQEASGFTFVLETDEDIIGKAHNDELDAWHGACASVCPEIEDVMEVDISQQWRGDRPLRQS